MKRKFDTETDQLNRVEVQRLLAARTRNIRAQRELKQRQRWVPVAQEYRA